MLTRIKKLFLSGESAQVFKGMLTLLVGASLARIVGLISIPILARIYSPEDYGVLALYTSFVAILVPIMTLRYVQAIPLPKTDLLAFNLFSVCLKLILFFSLVIAIVLALWGKSILGWFNMEALVPWRWLIVLGVAGASLYELLSLWATRKRQYKTIAKTQFYQSLIGNVVKIVFGLLAFKSSGMLIGQFLSQSAGITSFIKDARIDYKKYSPKLKVSKEKIVAKYYQGFVWFRLPSQLLMVLSVQAPVMMMAALYSKEVTGQLSLAVMALSFPVSLIGGAIAKAYYAEIAVLGKRNIVKIRKISFLVQMKLFSIGIPVTIIVFFLVKPIFILVFGEKWAVAGTYASLLSPYILLQFTSKPLVQVLNVVGSQFLFLIINLLRVIGLIVVYGMSVYYHYNSELFVMILGVYLFLFYALMTFLIFFMLSRKEYDV